MNKRTLNIGYIVPGWPLDKLPNGIVSYVNNILPGFDAEVRAIIFASVLYGNNHSENFIDLSKIGIDKTLISKLRDKLLFQTNLRMADKAKYIKLTDENAVRISKAISYHKETIDIIETEESFGIGYALKKKTNIPIVTRLHGPWHLVGPFLQTKHSNDFARRVFHEGEAIKFSDGITSPCAYVLDLVREYYNVELSNAKVIPNPILATPADLQWTLTKIVKPIILFVGRFDSVKGADLILLAFRLIALQNADVELQFVGPDKGVIIDGQNYSIEAFVLKFIPESHIRNRIQFLGHCSSQKVIELRQHSLITVISSRFENFSISLLESLSSGCPTVVTAVGGLKEIIRDGYNGLLVEPESADSIAEAVLTLLNDPIKMQMISKNAIEDSRKRYSPNIVAEQTVEYYKSILSSR